MLTLQGHGGPVRCLTYSPDGSRLVSGSEDSSVRVWSGFANGKVIRDCQDGVEALAFSPDGASLTIGTAAGQLILLEDGRQSKRPTDVLAHPGGVRSLAWAPGLSVLASAGWDRTAWLWEYPSRDRTALPVDGVGAITGLAFTPDAETLVAGTSGGALLYYNRLTRRVRASHNLNHPVFAVACSPDGRTVAVGDASGAVTLWDADAVQLATLTGHTWTVYGLAFTPDGRTLVSGGADGTVRVWDVATARERHTFRWHRSWVTCVAVSPDGLTAAAGGEDHTIVVWDLQDT